jgi:hypothetical protein
LAGRKIHRRRPGLKTFDKSAAFTATRRQIERHARHVGAADTNDLPRWLIAWVWFNPQSRDSIGAVMECARSMGRERFTPADAEAILEEAASTPKQMKADELAKWLGVTYVERQKLGLTRIGAKDVGKRSRAILRKLRDRRAKERKRRSRGAMSRAEYEAQSLTKTQPWLAENVSRRTWERRRHKAGTAVDAGPSTAVFLRPADRLASAARPEARSRRGRVLPFAPSVPPRPAVAIGNICTMSAVDRPQSNSEKNRVILRAHFGSHGQPRGFVCNGPRELNNFVHLQKSASAAVPGGDGQECEWQGTAAAA